MAKISWARTPPKTIIEIEFTVKISRIVKFRYWIARQLFTLAAWIINSNITYRQTLSTLEAEL